MFTIAIKWHFTAWSRLFAYQGYSECIIISRDDISLFLHFEISLNQCLRRSLSLEYIIICLKSMKAVEAYALGQPFVLKYANFIHASADGDTERDGFAFEG